MAFSIGLKIGFAVCLEDGFIFGFEFGFSIIIYSFSI